ncbi:MAG: hypothetical protein ACLU30_19840 [Odoribacter splanchnicus]
MIDADSMVNFPDFRAEERVYCMLLQVSGRSGRKGDRGKWLFRRRMLKQSVYHADRWELPDVLSNWLQNGSCLYILLRPDDSGGTKT